MPSVPAAADCPNCRIPLAIPRQADAGEMDCPVCTLALYYARLPANGEATIFLIRRGVMPVEEWRSVQQSLESADSVAIVEAVMLLDDYRDP